MYKNILVHLTGTDRDKGVLANSLSIARMFSSHLDCIHVTADPADIAMQSAQFDPISASMIGEILQITEEKLRKNSLAAAQTFADFVKLEKLAVPTTPRGGDAASAEFQELSGDEIDILTSRSRLHDLAVMAAGQENSDRFSAENVGNIVFGGGRPVLLAPDNSNVPSIKTIAIAWKDTPESARAVTAAMPLLAKAERIQVLSAGESDSQTLQCLDCTEGIVRHLRWHGFNVTGHFVLPQGRSVPEAILERAHALDADLLVTGAFGHSRLREYIFGGFTNHILHGVGLPVLLAH